MPIDKRPLYKRETRGRETRMRYSTVEDEVTATPITVEDEVFLDPPVSTVETSESHAVTLAEPSPELRALAARVELVVEPDFVLDGKVLHVNAVLADGRIAGCSCGARPGEMHKHPCWFAGHVRYNPSPVDTCETCDHFTDWGTGEGWCVEEHYTRDLDETCVQHQTKNPNPAGAPAGDTTGEDDDETNH